MFRILFLFFQLLENFLEIFILGIYFFFFLEIFMDFFF